MTVVPVPTSLSTAIVPPCARTTYFAIDLLLRVRRARHEYFGIPGTIDASGIETGLRESYEVVLLVDYTRDVRLHLAADACSRAGALVVVTCWPGVDLSVGVDRFALVDDVIEAEPPEQSCGTAQIRTLD
ncbi:hypothetical protein [Lentzea sp.]|uniref:hypothetical protein n=1 Tax=Lentzea sp. TaxID=56099 RepID=UPI002ED06ADF